MSKKAPKHREHNAPGSAQKPFGSRNDKAALLARMKKAQGGDAPLDVPSKPADHTATDEAKGKAIRGPEQLDD